MKRIPYKIVKNVSIVFHMVHIVQDVQQMYKLIMCHTVMRVHELVDLLCLK